MKKVFVTTNCQTYGLINSMNTLAKNAEVAGSPFGQIDNLADLGKYDIVFTAPEFASEIQEHAGVVRTIPFVFFDRFHPDVTYVKAGTQTVKGPCDAYHSLIVIGSYLNDLSPRDCLALFDDETFSKLSYYDGWSEAQQRLESEFANCGLDIRSAFQKWVAEGPFMHSFNHPHIKCLFDIANQALEVAGIDTYDYMQCPVHDNLKQASQLPVYPEIGMQLSVAGSYTFKRHGTYRSMSLTEFVEESYKSYSKHSKSHLRVGDSMRAVYSAFTGVL